MRCSVALPARSLLVATIFAFAGIVAPSKAAEPTTAPSSIKPTAPTAAGDSLARLHLAKGFTAELMAAEPLVNDPVAMAWGPDGRLWVVEMVDYPLGRSGNMEPMGALSACRTARETGIMTKPPSLPTG